MTNDTQPATPTPSNPFAFELLSALQQISAFSTNPTNFPHPFIAAAMAVNKAAAAAAAVSSLNQEENHNISKTTSPLPSLNSTLLQQTPTSTNSFQHQQHHHLLQSPSALCVSPQVDGSQNSHLMLQQSVLTSSSPPNLNSPSTTNSTSHVPPANMVEGGGMTTPSATADAEKPKRRSRLGGSSVKTAEVWRFFTQLPPPEMAATCMVKDCCKTIKATNSSTTGMIRHLRSCHPEEYKILQEARLHNLWLKAQKNGPDENARSHILQQMQDLEMCSPAHHRPATSMSKDEREKGTLNSRKRGSLSGCNTPQPKHSVEAIIGSGNHTENVTNNPTPWVGIGTGTQPNYLASLLQSINKQSQCPFEREIKPAVKIEPVADSEDNSPPAKRPVIAVQHNNCGKIIYEKVLEIPSREKPIKEEQKEDSVDVANELEEKVPLASLNQESFPVPEAQQQQQSQPKKRKAGGNGTAHVWLEDSKETKKINEQIALMLLIDNQSPSLVDRQGFRNFMKSVCPKYRMPGAKTFRDQILPHVRTLLCTDIANLQDQLQCNNPFGPSNISEVISKSARSGVSPANTVESGFNDDREDIENRSASSTNSSLLGRKSENFEALVQNSIRSAQNISQSFSYSIEVNSSGVGEMDSDTSSSVCSDMPVQTKIDEFLEHVSGRTDFTQEELSSLASRCYNLYTNFEEMEHLREELANVLNIHDRPLNMRQLCSIDDNKPFVAKCLAFVVKHMTAIMMVHEKCAIPHYISFSMEEHQRLSCISEALQMP